MSHLLHFGDIQLGDCWDSEQRTINETDVAQFAKLTGDFNPLHVDYEFARETPFRKPIAHGLLGLSFVAGLGSHSPDVDTVAFLGVHDWRFIKPVYFGDTVHVRTEVVDLQPQGRRRGRVFWKRSLINQQGETVQEGIFETLVSASGDQQRRGATAATGRSLQLHAATL